MTSPILLSPAGSFDSLVAAIDNGANAVYFGVGHLNMRSHATANFTADDLPEIARRCHEAGVAAWMTVNIIAYDSDLEDIEALLNKAGEAGVDAIIAVDPAVFTLARNLGLAVHLSVQANLSNWRSAQFYAQWADVVVAARELTIEQLTSLVENIRLHDVRGPSGELLRVEAFVHGALCIGLSGRCGMSLCEYNTSSNRGACYQPCRRSYIVKDDDTGAEFKIENKYIMSPKDLCTIAQLPRLLDSGISVLKIEGRARASDYVAHTTRCYREALDMYLRHEPPTREKISQWREELMGVFNRTFWEGGYYLGEQTDVWAGTRDSQATIKKVFTGTILHYYPKPHVAEIALQSGNLRIGDKILITGNTTGAIETFITRILHDDKDVDFAGTGIKVTVPIETKVRENDKVFVLKER